MAGSVSELEGLMVRLMADASQYDKVMDKVVGDATNDAKALDTLSKKVTASGRKLIADASRSAEAAAIGMTKHAIQVQRLEKAYQQNSITVMEYGRGLDAAAKKHLLVETAADKHNRRLDEAAAITLKVMNPQEQYLVQMRKLDDLFKKGYLSQTAYNRSLEEAYQKTPQAARATAALTAAQQAHAAVMAQGRALTQQYLTPLQRHQQNVQQLATAYQQGAITQATFTAGLRQLNGQLAQGNLTAFVGGLNNAQQALARIGGMVTGAGRVMSMAVTAPVAGMAGMGMADYATAESSINRAAAVAGETSRAVRDEMLANAMTISNEGLQSTTSLAEGYLHLVQAGLTAQESLSTLGTVEQFATAGTMDLEHASELLVKSQTVLGMRSLETAKNLEGMTRVSDVITKAANVSTASLEDFARSITTKSGAAARLLGKDIEELVAVLAALAAQGTTAELAGEQVYIMLRDVQAAAIKNKDAWDAMKVSAYDTGGEMMHVADIIESLETALAGMTDEQRKQAMMNLGFTDRSVAATNVLLGMSGAIRDYETQLKGATNETKRLSDEFENSFLGSLTKTWNQVRNLGIEIGTILIPYVQMLLTAVRTAVGWWSGMSQEMKVVTMLVAAFAAAIGPALLVLGGLITAVSVLVGGFAALLSFGWPVIAIIASVIVFVLEVAAAFTLAAVAVGALVWAILDPAGFSAGMEMLWKGAVTALRVTTRLFAAFVGWVAGPFMLMASQAFYNAVSFMVIEGSRAYSKFVWFMAEELKNVFLGRKSNASQFIIDMMFDMKKGVEENNFFKTAGDIIKEETGMTFEAAGKSAVEGFERGMKSEGGKDYLDEWSSMFGTQGDMNTGPAKKSQSEITNLLESLSDASIEAHDRAEKLTEKLKEQTATMGMAAHEATLWKIEQAHAAGLVTDAELEEARALATAATANKAASKETEEAARIMERYNKSLETSAKKYRTPAEEFEATQKRLSELFEEGLITIDAFTFSLEEAQEKMNKDMKVDVKIGAKVEDSVEAGTAEAQRRIRDYLALREEAAKELDPIDRSLEGKFDVAVPPRRIDDGGVGVDGVSKDYGAEIAEGIRALVGKEPFVVEEGVLV